ncbi:MAG: VOC family protein [Solirubrobacteraceae bacterium]
MTITGVTIRLRVDDLQEAVDFYEQLTGQTANRFAFGGAELAASGPFLLFAAPDHVAERLSRVAATISVDDFVVQGRALTQLGAEIVAPASVTPNGHRLVARHPDGSVFEYVGP